MVVTFLTAVSLKTSCFVQSMTMNKSLQGLGLSTGIFWFSNQVLMWQKPSTAAVSGVTSTGHITISQSCLPPDTIQ